LVKLRICNFTERRNVAVPNTGFQKICWWTLLGTRATRAVGSMAGVMSHK